jgi:hypothetical protein
MPSVQWYVSGTCSHDAPAFYDVFTFIVSWGEYVPAQPFLPSDANRVITTHKKGQATRLQEEALLLVPKTVNP